MDLLAVGAFARASRLSPKALIGLANEAGGSDNIACVAADVAEARP